MLEVGSNQVTRVECYKCDYSRINIYNTVFKKETLCEMGIKPLYS